VKRSGAPSDSVATVRNDFSRGIDIPRTLLQRHLEFIHCVQLIHMPDDILHLAFAVNFPRDIFERIHDFGVDPLVHILDDFIVMIVMRVHIQRLLSLGCELFLTFGDGDDIAVIFIIERFASAAAALFGISVRETFNHPELITEYILDGDECEDDEYA